jgi:CheY-like chemotaxis protein
VIDHERENTVRILVVENDDTTREVLAVLLQGEGYEVASAPTGVEALKICAAWGPSLILLDLYMPEMDGKEFAQRYRETAGPHAPIVLLSASSETDAVMREIGAQETIHKPFDIEQILDVVSRRTPHR